MKKIILIGLGFVALCALFLLVNMPMRWVVAQVQQNNPTIAQLPIEIKSIEGSIWSGHLAIAGKEGLPIKGSVRRLNWMFNGSELTSARLDYDLMLERVEVGGANFGDFKVWLFYGGAEDFMVQVEDVNSPLSLQATLQLNDKGQKLLSGTIKLQQENASLQALLGLAGNQIKPDGSFSIILP